MEGQKRCCSWFHTSHFRFMRSIALRERQCLHESQAGMTPCNISNDLVDNTVVITTAAFQTPLGDRKKYCFLGSGLASHPCCSRDPERKTHAGAALLPQKSPFPLTHQLTASTKPRQHGSGQNSISSWSAGDLSASSTAGTWPLLSLLLNGR